MAPQQPADLDAYDRKLRPIYEAIEVGNHKVWSLWYPAAQQPAMVAHAVVCCSCGTMHLCIMAHLRSIAGGNQASQCGAVQIPR